MPALISTSQPAALSIALMSSKTRKEVTGSTCQPPRLSGTHNLNSPAFRTASTAALGRPHFASASAAFSRRTGSIDFTMAESSS